jgi:hypothetical protein
MKITHDRHKEYGAAIEQAARKLHSPAGQIIRKDRRRIERALQRLKSAPRVKGPAQVSGE